MKRLFYKIKNMEHKNEIFLVVVIFIALAIVSIYSTFAYDVTLNENTSSSTTTDLSYLFDLTTNSTKQVTISAGTTKNVEMKLTNSNAASIKYGLVYSMVSPTSVLEDLFVHQHPDSVDSSQGVIATGGTKKVTLLIENYTTSDVTIKLSSVVGYENGGDLSSRLSTGQVFITTAK